MEKVLLSLSMISGRKKALESFYYKTLFPILLFYLILYIFANASPVFIGTSALIVAFLLSKKSLFVSLTHNEAVKALRDIYATNDATNNAPLLATFLKETPDSVCAAEGTTTFRLRSLIEGGQPHALTIRTQTFSGKLIIFTIRQNHESKLCEFSCMQFTPLDKK
jgi:hypothetical protein